MDRILDDINFIRILPKEIWNQILNQLDIQQYNNFISAYPIFAYIDSESTTATRVCYRSVEMGTIQFSGNYESDERLELRYGHRNSYFCTMLRGIHRPIRIIRVDCWNFQDVSIFDDSLYCKYQNNMVFIFDKNLNYQIMYKKDRYTKLTIIIDKKDVAEGLIRHVLDGKYFVKKYTRSDHSISPISEQYIDSSYGLTSNS